MGDLGKPDWDGWLAAAGGGVRCQVDGVRCQVDVDGAGCYGWRLVAQNGRVVAVSGTAFGERDACVASFVGLCVEYAALAGGVQHASEGNGWVWHLRDARGRLVAASGRSYERNSTCRAAYDRFRSLLRELGASLPAPRPAPERG